jgi:hypothetical protein
LTKLGNVISASPTTGVIHGTVKRGFFNFDTDLKIQVYKISENKTKISIDASRERMSASPFQEAHVDLEKFTEALMANSSLRSTSSDRVGWGDPSASSQGSVPIQPDEEQKITIKCENCDQKLRIPRRRKNIHDGCPKCHHEYN